jgi:hypothetical protein
VVDKWSSFQCAEVLLDAGVVNSQKFIRSGNHIDAIWFALRSQPVEKLKNLIVSVSVLQNTDNNLKQCFAE